MKTVNIAVLPGDGIGPEVTEQALKVLKKACSDYGVSLQTESYPFGGASLDKHDIPVTEEVIQACQQADAVFLGAVGGPKWDQLEGHLRPEAGLLQMRKALGVYANLRPITVHDPLVEASTLKPEVVRGVDILIVRELTGGIYFGSPRFTREESGTTRAVDTMAYTIPEIQRVARKAFEAAEKRNSSVFSIDKANVLDSSRLWRKTVIEEAGEWPSITLQHMLVDNCAMQLIRDPKQFDVMVTGNLFGDILSDEAAMLTGSIGMLPSASLGDGSGLYEPVHGSAPDIAGQDKANPLAAIASAALLCRYSLDLEEAATAIETAVAEVLSQGYRTADIQTGADNERPAGCEEIGDAVIKALQTSKKTELEV
ncbi:MAG: 3-isopropylmalate dehydrogenase [Balneolaceae bacterium]